MLPTASRAPLSADGYNATRQACTLACDVLLLCSILPVHSCQKLRRTVHEPTLSRSLGSVQRGLAGGSVLAVPQGGVPTERTGMEVDAGRSPL